MEGSVKMQSSKERSREEMKKKTLGMMISSLRKESGMTQLELAEKMGVTDKAVCSNRNLFESPSSCLLAQEF